MKIAITGGKGGVGKSMVAINLAVLEAEQKRTLLVDCDAECPNDHLLLALARKKIKNLYQPIPKFDLKKCVKCGKCALACKQEAILFVKNKYPVFLKDICIGCKACLLACPQKAISTTAKNIGTIYQSRKNNLDLITGELKIGELASGEVVASVREFSEKYCKKIKAQTVFIDSSAGIGCPVIASIVNTDFVVAVTEPTPAALYDLKRALHLIKNFNLEKGVIINKATLDKKFATKIKRFLKRNKIKLLGEIPYHSKFVDSTIKMKPIVETNQEYRDVLLEIKRKINL